MARWKNQDDVLSAFRSILLEYGEDISPDEYDALSSNDRPSRPTLRKYFGAWQAAKHAALSEGTTLNNRYLIEQNERLKKQIEKQRNLNQVFIDNCLASIAKTRYRTIAQPSPELSPQNLELHALVSDCHVGEVVDAGLTQGLGSYNTEIFKQRAALWADKIMLFREQDKRSLGLNKLVIDFAGDIVTGELIYKSQAYFIDSATIDQVYTAMNVFANCILSFAKVFPEIEIYAVNGNHGRAGAKGEGHPKTNFDGFFYHALKQALSNQDHINVYISDCPTMIVKHGNFNHAINHNDTVNAWNGIPYYGLERRARRLSDLYGMPIHYKLGGHFHQTANLGDEIFLNGTMVGGSDLSINKMNISSLPSQKIFYFHPIHGINRESNLILGDRPVLEPDEYGIYTSHE